MSYCRWSCDDFQCDIYCYESSSGFEVMVAAKKYVFDAPLPPEVDIENLDGWLKRHGVVSKMLKRAKLVDLGLPHDGQSFLEATAAECADRLEALKALGYRVPQYAIDSLREEKA